SPTRQMPRRSRRLADGSLPHNPTPDAPRPRRARRAHKRHFTISRQRTLQHAAAAPLHQLLREPRRHGHAARHQSLHQPAVARHGQHAHLRPRPRRSRGVDPQPRRA
ncbi:hypothetical protein LTR16_011354, partial [Cryomyces antarcticus]